MILNFKVQTALVFCNYSLNWIMASNAPSDSESNVSGFYRYSNKDVKYLYTSMIENMESINQDILQVENNLKNIIQVAGPLEGQLSVLLQSLPKPCVNLPMETD